MSGIHFAEPQWVHLLWVVLAVAALLAWLERRGGSALSRFISRNQQPHLVRQTSSGRRATRLLFLTLSGCFLVLALMRPQWGLQFVSTPRVGAEIMVCLDVSKSMLAEDVTPNRLERAKAELRDLLTYLDGDQVGLIAFAGRAAVLSPMTPDFGFLRIVLDQAGPHSVSRGGTRLEEPLRKAIAGFGQAGDVSRSILLITDGEDHDSFPMEAAKAAAERGIRILAIGFGAESGSEIMITDPKTGVRSVLHDSSGNPVVSRLDGNLLRDMALETGGAYIPAGTGLLDLESIYDHHIAGLTRGMLDGRSRSVRNDAFQWAVLLALLSLVAAVGTAAGRRSTRRSGSGRALSWLSAAIIAGALGGTTLPADAQTAAGADPGDDPPTQEPQVTADDEQQTDRTLAPRTRYNLALEAFSAGSLEQAGTAFETARGEAGTDGEVRFRASYNLGWVAVKQADAVLESAPEEALSALHSAADWFREAISLRPQHTPSRHNLELVLRRALELADSLNQQKEQDIAAMLQAMIEAQRTFVGTLGEGVALGDSDRAEIREQSRRTMRGLASAQLTVLSDGETLAQRCGEELAALEGLSEEERKPEQAIRMVQLENLLHYLHRAEERMGQARGQMRRLQSERAYRRAWAALGELKRARDQLQDPVTRLDALLADGAALIKATSLKASVENNLPGSDVQPSPAWLTQDYLSETQRTLQERTGELHQGIAAGLEQATEGGQEPRSKEEMRVVEQLQEAEPLIGAASAAFEEALAALDGARITAAVDPQRLALGKLAEARERFLDLRRLIELLYQTEQQVLTLITSTPEQQHEEVSEYLPAVVDAHADNEKRNSRVREMITRQLLDLMAQEERAGTQPQNPPGSSPQGTDPAALKAERERFEEADRLQVEVDKRMPQAQQALEDALQAGSSVTPLMTAQGEVAAAVDAIEALRRLFFSLIDHLKEATRDQIDLNDATEEVKGLAATRSEPETAAALGPLTPRQSTLAEKVGSIGDALGQQAEQMTQGTPPNPTPGQEQDPAEQAQKAEQMKEAAELVASARGAMREAWQALRNESPSLEEARGFQDGAVEKLLEAIALLEPPQQNQQEQEQEQEQQQDQGEGEQQPQESKEEKQPQNVDQRELMQGVRDREAQRREEQEKKRRGGYQPVEKDW